MRAQTIQNSQTPLLSMIRCQNLTTPCTGTDSRTMADHRMLTSTKATLIQQPLCTSTQLLLPPRCRAVPAAH